MIKKNEETWLVWCSPGNQSAVPSALQTPCGNTVGFTPYAKYTVLSGLVRTKNAKKIGNYKPIGSKITVN